MQAFMKPIKDDARSYGQRCADAVVELARQGSSGKRDRAGGKRDGAGPRPQLIIRASAETLAGLPGAPAGELEGGGTVPAETVQRHACDSAISRIIGRGELDQELSHPTRTIPASTRRALESRDRQCVFRGCDRPPNWCDGHHLVWWTRGGATTLPNLALPCRPHHRTVHEEGWSLERHKDGRFAAIPPRRAAIPPERRAMPSERSAIGPERRAMPRAQTTPVGPLPGHAVSDPGGLVFAEVRCGPRPPPAT